MDLCVRIARRVAAAAIIFAAMSAMPARAQDESATVAVSPASDSVSSSSDEFTVDIVVQGVTNLGAFDFVLSFDQDVLEPVSVVKGDFLGSSGREVLCPEQTTTIEPGAVKFVCLTLRATPAGADGDGTLAIVTFKPKNRGTTRLSLTRVRLLPPDPDAGDIPSTVVDGELKVEGGGLSTMWLAVGIGVPLVLVVAVGAAAVVRSRSRRFGAPRPDTLPE